jgi:hypothetical protein
MSSSTAKPIPQLLEMLKMLALVEKRLNAPGFSHALKLDYASLSEQQFFLTPAEDSGNSLIFKYKIPSHLTLPHYSSDTNKWTHSPDHATTSLSTLLAILDEVTTWSALVGDMARRRFGVSVNFRTEWAKPAAALIPGQEVLIHTTNSKIGKNLVFLGAKVCDAHSCELIAFGSQVKYLDMGRLNFALSRFGWPMTKLVLTSMIPYDPQEDKANGDQYQLRDLFGSLKITSLDNATFTPQKIHASLGGPLHGGCSAILMELVGSSVAQRELRSSHVKVESMQVDYFSTPAAKSDVDVRVQTLSPAYGDPTNSCNNANTLHIQTQIISRGRVCCQGNLRFATDTTC